MKTGHYFSILFLLIGSLAFSQGLNISIISPKQDTAICPGETLNLEAVTAFLITDFDNQAIGTGWSSSQANPVYTNPCGPGPKNWHLWVGTTPSASRTLVTNPYDLTDGNACYVQFWMRYGLEPGLGPCEDPDEPNEGVHLQYSTNGGATWLDFSGPSVLPVGNLNTTPPFYTQTPGSGGYWVPILTAASQLTSTLYHWNLYRCPIPQAAISPNTQFRWAQLANSAAGFDAWGIDEVIIGCDPGSILWNTGNTTTTDTVTPTTSTTYWVSVTDSNMKVAYDTVHVIVGSVYDIHDTVYKCEGDFYPLPTGNNVTNPGTYISQVTSQYGCDSVVHTYLYNNPVYQNTIIDTICSGDVYILPDGSQAQQSGLYIDTLPTFHGCDSAIITRLTILPSSYITTEVYLCQGQPYTLPGGITVTQSGVYLDTLLAQNGCDSIIETTLNYWPTYNITKDTAICYGNEYLLPDNSVVNASGSYTVHLFTDKGCDSIITTNLIVNLALSTEAVFENYNCFDSTWVGAYSIGGQPPYRYRWSNGSLNQGIPEPQTGSMWVEVTDSFGCQAMDTIIIPQRVDYDFFSLIPDTLWYTDEPVKISVSTTAPVKKWYWLVDSTVEIGSQSFYFHFTQAGWHRMDCRITTFDTCTRDTSFFIYLKPKYDYSMPNAFTPDGDGLNDTYYPILNPESDINYILRIYNRWGELVFTGHNEG
ncbi:MAG TPA: hypothetical protein DCG19_08300, partial [Cryomorphaceae bacterium]|nr:hypothetical protein [Cryomorphaceae bacterium]